MKMIQQSLLGELYGCYKERGKSYRVCYYALSGFTFDRLVIRTGMAVSRTCLVRNLILSANENTFLQHWHWILGILLFERRYPQLSWGVISVLPLFFAALSVNVMVLQCGVIHPLVMVISLQWGRRREFPLNHVCFGNPKSLAGGTMRTWPY